jgi:hypothetical protein
MMAAKSKETTMKRSDFIEMTPFLALQQAILAL